jgi:hypothetical protein
MDDFRNGIKAQSSTVDPETCGGKAVGRAAVWEAPVVTLATPVAHADSLDSHRVSLLPIAYRASFYGNYK